MRRTTLTLVVLAVPIACACAAASRASTQPPLLTLSPGVAVRGQNATLTVTRIDVPSLEVRVVGGTANLGRPLPWTPLRNDGRGWHGLLPAPELRGFYPLELRVRRGSPVMRSEQWLLPVLARGTRARPSFSTPEGVAAGGCERCRSRRGCRDETVASDRHSTGATTAGISCSSSRTRRPGTGLSRIDWGCSSQRSATAPTAPGGSSKPRSCPSPPRGFSWSRAALATFTSDVG